MRPSARGGRARRRLWSGRIALALTEYLAPSARYEGFDVVEAGITWCRDEITPRYPNFRFTHVDLYNRSYNPGGRVHAAEMRFPYGDEQFDFVYLTSVFTHMLPADVERYLGEVAPASSARAGAA